MSVAVLTDSAASVPGDLLAKYAIGVVPIRVVVGGQDYLDGELPLAEVLDRAAEGVSTAAPAPGEWRAAIDAALEGGSSVVVLTIASAMSATHQAAVVAAREAGAETGAEVVVVDTLTAAGAEALVVLAAARVAADGGDVASVLAAAERVRAQVRLVATVDSLDQLVRSGRVPGIAGFAGRMLGVNPLFEFAGGKVRPLRPAFSRNAALERIVQACLAGPSERGRRSLHVAALHADDEATARRLLSAATYRKDPAEAFIGSFSAGMIAHTGPALAGLAWWWE